MLTRIRWGIPLVSSTVPGGEVKPAILPVRKEAALSGEPTTLRMGTSLSGSSLKALRRTRAATSEELPTRLMPTLLPFRFWGDLIDSLTTNSYGRVLIKETTQTRSA